MEAALRLAQGRPSQVAATLLRDLKPMPSLWSRSRQRLLLGVVAALGDEGTSGALLALLEDTTLPRESRRSIARALALAGHLRASDISRLVEMAHLSEWVHLRAACALALTHMGPSGERAVVEGFLRGSDEFLPAVVRLGNRVCPAVAEHFTRSLPSPDPSVMTALAEIATRTGCGAEALIDAARRADDRLRVEVASALARLSPRTPDECALLIDLAVDEAVPMHVRTGAASALASADSLPRASAGRLIPILVAATDPRDPIGLPGGGGWGEFLVSATSAVVGARDADFAAALLRSKSSLVRGVLLKGLSLRPPSALSVDLREALLTRLGSDDLETARLSLRCLRHGDEGRGLAGTIGASLRRGEGALELEVAAALGAERDIERLREACADPRPARRLEAALLLSSVSSGAMPDLRAYRTAVTSQTQSDFDAASDWVNYVAGLGAKAVSFHCSAIDSEWPAASALSVLVLARRGPDTEQVLRALASAYRANSIAAEPAAFELVDASDHWFAANVDLLVALAGDTRPLVRHRALTRLVANGGARIVSRQLSISVLTSLLGGAASDDVFEDLVALVVRGAAGG